MPRELARFRLGLRLAQACVRKRVAQTVHTLHLDSLPLQRPAHGSMNVATIRKLHQLQDRVAADAVRRQWGSDALGVWAVQSYWALGQLAWYLWGTPTMSQRWVAVRHCHLLPSPVHVRVLAEARAQPGRTKQLPGPGWLMSLLLRLGGCVGTFMVTPPSLSCSGLSYTVPGLSVALARSFQAQLTASLGRLATEYCFSRAQGPQWSDLPLGSATDGVRAIGAPVP